MANDLMIKSGAIAGRDPMSLIGERIKAVQFLEEAPNRDGGELKITFDSGIAIAIYDDGQSCCEHRYMATDDDPQWLVGKLFAGIEGKEAPTEEDQYGEPKEIIFVEIKTDQGSISFKNYNEHNGYYGGFSMQIREVPA
jgi:hypothetical protein